MSARSSRLFRALPAVVVVLVLCGGLAWPFVDIQLRLCRNGAIAARVCATSDRLPISTSTPRNCLGPRA